MRAHIVVQSTKGQQYHMVNRSCYGLSLCMSGQITYTMNGKTYTSHPGNAVILPQGGTYSLVCDKEGLFPVMDFHCQNFSCGEITVLPLENPQACLQDFEKLQSLQLYNKSKLKLYSVFYELLHEVAHSGEQVAVPLHAVMKYIEQHIQDPSLSNTVLAKHIGISEVYLRKQFLSHCQVTPKQYILDMRLRKAKQMLVDTPFTVAAIAEECGFSSVYHFCRAFKQRTGQTPTQYAAANRIYHI